MTSAQIQDVNEIMQTRYMGIVSFSILLWDHIITFGDEVEYIWKGTSKGPLVWLFFVNRYLTPLGFIVNIVAYNLQSWSVETCQHYIRYEGSMTVIGIEIVGVMMLLRIYALYYRQSKLIIAFVGFILLVETGVNGYLLHTGHAVHHIQPWVKSCTMIFANSPAASASAWLPLLYETVILGLTLYRIAPSIRETQPGYIMRTMFQDGLLYYSVICSVTLVLTIMIPGAPDGLKNITAQLELLLTVAMMSRITLRLKKQVHSPRVYGQSWDDGAIGLTFSRIRSNSDSMNRARSRSSASFNGGLVNGKPMTRLAPVHILSTIASARTSVTDIHTPRTGHNSTRESLDLADMVSRIQEELDHPDVTATTRWQAAAKDEEQ